MRHAPCAALLLALAAALSARAEPAQLVLTHHGRLLDQSDAPVSRAVKMRFSLHTASGADAQAPGAEVWSATYERVPVTEGFFAVELGALPGPALPASVFDGTDRFLAVALDDGPELRPRQRITFVPYALHAARSDVAANAEKLGGESPASFRDASRLVGTVPAGSLGAGAASITTLGTITAGAWRATPVADAFIEGAAGWNAKLSSVAASAPLAGTGTASDPLRVQIGSGPGTLAAGDDARFTTLANGLTSVRTDALAAAATAKSEAIAAAASATDVKLQGFLPKAGGALSGGVLMGGGLRLADDATTCDPSIAGTLRWRSGQVEVCDGLAWRALGQRPDGTATNPGRSCRVLRESGILISKDYFLDPDGVGGLAAFQAYCDMTTDGGGWTRVEYTADVAFQNWFTAGDAYRYHSTDFPLRLSKAQIDALRAVSVEARQRLVARCENVIMYLYTADGTHAYAAGFRFHTGAESARGQQSYAPYAVTVPQDGCRGNGAEGGTLANATIFDLRSTALPVTNVQLRDSGDPGESYGYFLLDNPAWFR